MANLSTGTIIGVLAAVALGYYIFQKKKFPFAIGSAKRVSGNTPFLNLYTTDFTAQAQNGRIDPVIGREEEVRKLTQVLSRRSKNNAILVGEAGVGKTAIVEGLAQRIVHGQIPESLSGKRVLSLDVATLMSGTKYRGEFEERAKKIIQEIAVSNRSIILFVDEVHSLIQSQGSEGSLNLSDILKPALSRGELQMVGATTNIEYEKYFLTNLSLERRFQPIEVNEPSPAETLIILQGVKDKYREYHKVEFTDAALETAVRLSKKMVKDRKLPDKAIDAMDEAAAMVKVAHLDPKFSAILYTVALKMHPEVAEIWKKIQIQDKIIASEKNSVTQKKHIQEREALEADLRQAGIVVVDSSDIEKILNERSS